MNYGKQSTKMEMSLTWTNSMMMAKMILVISVKKFTLIGLNLNFPSTLHMYTNMGYKKGGIEAVKCQTNLIMYNMIIIQLTFLAIFFSNVVCTDKSLQYTNS
jgi:hypothetical protein